MSGRSPLPPRRRTPLSATERAVLVRVVDCAGPERRGVPVPSLGLPLAGYQTLSALVARRLISAARGRVYVRDDALRALGRP